MAVENLVQLIEALSIQDWQRVIGTPESDWLDFKNEIYLLNDDRQKTTLATDVAAFANGERDAVLVLGYSTEREMHSAQEVASEHKPVPTALVNGETVMDVLKERVFPALSDVKLHWFYDDDTKARGVLVISIPRQGSALKPFVVERVLDGDRQGGKHAIALPRRDGNRNTWARAEELQQLLCEATRGRLGEDLPDGFVTEATVRVDQFTAASAVVGQVEQLQGWANEPRLFLQALPPTTGPSILPKMYSSNGVIEQLRAHRPLRAHGWSLENSVLPERREGAIVQLKDERRALWLAPSGLLTVGATIVRDYLGWNMNSHRAETAPVMINSLALCELVLEFCRFVEQVLCPLAPPASDWCLSASARALAAPLGSRLRQGLPDPHPTWDDFGHLPVPKNAADMPPIRFKTAGESAFEILKWFYGRYSLPPEAVPFATGMAVDAERIVRGA